MKTIQKLMDLSGRVALITGGAGHLGYCMAETLAELGADIVLVDINEQGLEASTQRLKDKNDISVTQIVIDLEVASDIDKITATLAKQGSQLDILINNAAFAGTANLEGWVADFEKQTVETWRRALEVNLTSVFSLAQSCFPLLKKSNHASIINIASIYGTLGPDMSLYDGTKMGNPAAYAASKGGLIQLTRWLATTLSPDIRVNCISPGGIERGQPEVFQDKYKARTPLKRMATEEDFKGSIAYLASDMSNYVTGQNLMVDGGWGVW